MENILGDFHQIVTLGQFGLVVAMSVSPQLCPLPMLFSQGSKGGPRGEKLSPIVASVPGMPETRQTGDEQI